MEHDVQMNSTPETAASDVNDFGELALSMEESSALYGLLATCYRHEPSPEFIAALRATRFPASTGSEFMDRGYRLIATYLSRVGNSAAEELAADFARTFIGNGTDSYSAAYPQESVHVGRKRLLMQAARDEVLAIYRAYGLEKSGELKDGEDHITYELEFMGFLAGRCAEALRAGDEVEAEALVRAQQHFLADHLLNWVGKLTKQMRYFAQTDFYRGVSYLTFGYLKESEAFLRDITA